MTRRRGGDPHPPKAAAPAATAPGRALEVVVAALVVARLLVPPEGSVLGRTLGITQLWFAAALLAVWQRLRDPAPRRRLDLLDAGVLTLTAAHVLSALRVVALHDGNRRAAITMLWEWLALGVSFLLLRQIVSDSPRRTAWQKTMLALAVSTAGLGVWQHYVWYPSLARSFLELRDEYDQVVAARPQSASDAAVREQRLVELRRKLDEQGIPVEGPARRQFEDRVIGSTEPIGLFALANTLGGWLTVWLVVGAGLVLHVRGALFSRRGAALPMLGLIAFCLVLTKSRTAWVGVVAGLAAWGMLAWRGRGNAALSGRRLAIASGIAVAAVAALFGAAAWAGGRDREVIGQAPRSLRFRLQYWTAAMDIVRERWQWGTGPGNFRQRYLKHKLPEASEEIADPHNFVFDVWTSSGLLGLLGLALAAAGAAKGAVIASVEIAPSADGGPSPEAGTEPARGVAQGAFLAFTGVLAGLALFNSGSSEIVRLFAVAAGWMGAMWLLAAAGVTVAASRACLGGAAAALLVHLLGAGGIEMPAITQCLFLLAVLAQRDAPAAAEAAPAAGWREVVAGGLATGLFAGCLFTATVPVLSCEAFLASGDAAMIQGAGFTQAARAYERAAEADPFSPEPLGRLAELHFSRSRQRPSGRGGDDDFEAAVRLDRLALELDPHNPHGYRRLGAMWLSRHGRTRAKIDADESVRWYSAAVERYPHNALLRSERAEAFAAAGLAEAAAEEAAVALELDAINQREGHVDKRLTEPAQARMKTLVDRGKASVEP